MSNEENLTVQEEQNAASGAEQQPSGDGQPSNPAADNALSAEEQAAAAESDNTEEPQPAAEESNGSGDPLSEEGAEEKSEKDEQSEKAPSAEGVKTPSREKAKPARSTKTPEQKRKLFKVIYYPALALFVLLMLIFSAIDGVSGYSPKAYGDSYYTAVNKHIDNIAVARSVMSQPDEEGLTSVRDYIVSTLVGGGFTRVAEVKTERDDNSAEEKLERITTITDWAMSNGVNEPTVTLQTATLDADLQSELGLEAILAGTELTNIIAAIPSGKDNAGAAIITVRYDSRSDSVEAASAAFVANAIQSLIEMKKSGAKLNNDIIVVFTEDLDHSYGAYAFFNLFDGLNDVVARATAGISLEAYGNGGTLALTDASGAGLDYIYAYTKVSGNTFNSSVVPDSISANLSNKNAVAAFGDIPAVQVAVLGGLDAAQSSLDNVENLSQSIVKQQAQLIKNFMEKFGDSTDKYSAEGSGSTVFFSYLDGGTVAYTAVASYVIGAIILAVGAAVIVTMALKKTFSLKNMFIALGVELLVVVSTLAALLAAYFLVTLMLTGFGVLPIHAITQLTYSNAGIIIAAIIITTAAAFGFTTLYKKLFRITSSDTVRGTAMLFGLVGAVMSFVCPAYSFITSWLGLLMLGVLLTSVCLHKKFKSKFGLGMDRLYLYAIPVALCLPLIMPELTMLAHLLPLVLLPVIFTVFTALLGVGVPYLDRTQPLLDKVAGKINHTIRVERVVTEKVEDRAKKGKFTEKTYKRVDKEKVPFRYKNYFGVSVLAVLGIVIALFSGGFGVSYNKTLTNYYTYSNAIYNDSLIYELNINSSGETTQSIVVNDLMTYKYLRYNISDLEWDGENDRYSKTVNYNVSEIIARSPAISSDSGVYTVTTYDGARSNVTITIPSASSITKITIKESSKVESGYEGYIYEFDNVSEIVLRLPYGFDTSFTMEIEGDSPSQFEYEEYRAVTVGDIALDIVDEWNQVRNSSDVSGLGAGIVIKQTFLI